MSSVSRRSALKLMGAAAATTSVSAGSESIAKTNVTAAEACPWGKTHNRVWLGGKYWANPMEDWRVIDGVAECASRGGDRNVHLLTHQLTDPSKPFAMSVRMSQAEAGKKSSNAGFRIGVRSDINEYRSNSFAKGGVDCGIVGDKLQVGKATTKLTRVADAGEVILQLQGVPNGEQVKLVLTAIDAEGKTLGSVEQKVAGERLLGNVAIVNNFDPAAGRKSGARHRFADWQVVGDAFTVSPQHEFGPLLWSMYTLSDSRSDEGFVLKLSVLTGPLGERDNQTVQLAVERDGDWQTVGEESLDTDAWTATFRIANWDATQPANFKLTYQQAYKTGEPTTHTRSGVIRANPAGRPLRLGALTCQNDYAFPYAPVAENVLKLDLDMLYFSGDQLYENHGGYGIIRNPADRAILNYLRKFYQFGWSFGEAMRDRPTVCIPDDHDVFQGNIWGEGGKKMGEGRADTTAGYRQPARMVNVVHTTCAGHHPAPYDPTPCEQDISVYYGELVYGNVGFAILGDRQWKSGPQHVDTGGGRADHVTDRSIDPKQFDKPGLDLLGERQEKFLEHWADDWRGHELKVLLSQTLFAAAATHHGTFNGYLVGDLDSGGWPQTPRNRAVSILRNAKPLHINGDQHLTTMVQYGVDRQRDSSWSFCTPAIAVGYPRWWRPDEVDMPHENRPQHGNANTGEFVDSFGNFAYVYAVGNPEVGDKRNRYELAHQKGSGFGLVTIDTQAKTYTCESYRFLIDAADGDPDNQFPGWPITIHQSENAGDNRIG